MKQKIISNLTDEEVDDMISLLMPIDNQIDKRVNYVIKHYAMTKPHALEYIVTDNPLLWAKVYLDWEPRDYQKPIILEGKKSNSLILRLGRRLGKTESMCVIILYYAYTQANKGENDKYDILIICPYDDQVDLIYKRLHQLIEGSPLLKSLITRDIYHKIEMSIGKSITTIAGFTGGANNTKGGGNNTRGQAADLLILDEADYLGSTQITNIMNIRNEDPGRIKMICASTPSGKHEEYYRWCIGASKSYLVSDLDLQNNDFTGYIINKKRPGEGNGWVQIYAPSNVNKKLLKINPDTNQTYLEDLKDELPEMRYEQEVLAKFGEEDMGVYQKKFIEKALEEGKRINLTYSTTWDADKRKEYLRSTRGKNILCLGCDWDKYQSGSHMVCMEFDRFHADEEGHIIPCFKVLFRIEIPRSESTYVNAMNKIIELNEEYKFDWIAIDRGYGETQLELLHRYGEQHPSTGLADKVIGYQFSQKVTVVDPYTRKKDEKHMKPFMVNNSVNLFEKCRIILNPSDKFMIEELEEYRIESYSAAGLPTFSSVNEHAIDAMNLALLIFAQKYDTLLKKVYSSKIGFIENTLDRRDMNVEDRALKKEDVDKEVMIVPIKVVRNKDGTTGMVSVTPVKRGYGRYPNEFNRGF